MKNLICFVFLCSSFLLSAQDVSPELKKAIQTDDVDLLTKVLSADHIDDCIGSYSLLTITIKLNAVNSLKFLLDKGANQDGSCSGTPPLIHAIQDGKLDLVKVMVGKGADLHLTHNGRTVYDYALKFEHQDIIDYLKKEKGMDLYRLDGVDGPYIVGDSIFRVSADNQIVREKLSPDRPIKVEVGNEDRDVFEVQLRNKHETEKGIYDQEGPIIAISDIEGNFDGFYSFLVNNGVMDVNYNWTFGKGHLVLGGDFVDRGPYVTPVLWLIYLLEGKAAKAGGKVHFVLGNHEVMNIQGDTRYANPKYLAMAQRVQNNPDWEEAFRYLFSLDSELGRWLRSKNAVEKVGDYLFVHAGLSPELVDSGLSIPKMNHLIRKNLDKDLFTHPSEDERIMFLMGSKSPLWYRGFVTNHRYYSVASAYEVEQVRKKYDAEKIIIGHTIAEDITPIQDGQVIMIDIKHKEIKNSGGTKGLLIEKKVLYKVDDLGKKTRL